MRLFQALQSRRGVRRAEDASAPPLHYPCLLMSLLNVIFLKEITQNVHENQQAKPRPS